MLKKKNYLVFKNNIDVIFQYTDKELASMIDQKTFKKYKDLKMTLDFLENGLNTQYNAGSCIFIDATHKVSNVKGLFVNLQPKVKSL